MPDVLCPRCHKAISAAEQAAFCPYCGEKLQKQGPDLAAVRDEADPVKKHNRLIALQKEYPDHLEIAEEILLLGRLYERGQKGVDFSIIKSFVLNVYLEPGTLKKSKREALRQEIFHHPDLDRCLEICGNKEQFLHDYLTRLSEEFIRLFLKGSSRYMRTVFGFTSTSKAPKYLATPAAQMLVAMHSDDTLDAEQKTLLMQSFYAAFARQLNGETKYLNELIDKYKLPVETQ